MLLAPAARIYFGLVPEVNYEPFMAVEPWSRLDVVIKELVEIGDERVLAHVVLRGEGRGSGMNLEGDLYYGYWLRHGRFLRVEDHLTLRGALYGLGLQGETLEAAGLRE